MGQNTSRLGLYLPGGGSTGLITPDEPADIDKINDNMTKLDADAGAYVCTSSTRPATPYNGKIIFETDTRKTMIYKSATTSWEPVDSQGKIVANAAARDALFASPTQGTNVFRTDIGVTETYYAAWNATTNTGGKTPAGWYSGQDGGLVPITPTSISYTGTSASVAASGKVSFTNVTDLRLQGIFSSKFDAYVLRFGYKNSAAMEMRCRLMSGSTLMNSSQYAWTGNATIGGVSSTYSGSGIDWFAWAGNISGNGNTTDYTISFPQDNTAITRITGLTSNYAGGWQHATFSGGYNLFDVADGFQAYSTSAANFTGWVTVYGYRK